MFAEATAAVVGSEGPTAWWVVWSIGATVFDVLLWWAIRRPEMDWWPIPKTPNPIARTGAACLGLLFVVFGWSVVITRAT